LRTLLELIGSIESERDFSYTVHQLPFVQIFKVKALKFEPKSQDSYLNIDGEIFSSSSCEFKIKQNLVTLMCSPKQNDVI